MTDDGALCADAGFCGTRRRHIWRMFEGELDPEARETIVRMAGLCPSGRLQIAGPDGVVIEPAFAPSIGPIPNGPLWVRGGIPVETSDGYTFEVRNRVTLCRCGGSQNKPFCDGAHKSNGFQAS